MDGGLPRQQQTAQDGSEARQHQWHGGGRVRATASSEERGESEEGRRSRVWGTSGDVFIGEGRRQMVATHGHRRRMAATAPVPPVERGGRQVGVGLGRFARWAKGPSRLGSFSLLLVTFHLPFVYLFSYCFVLSFCIKILFFKFKTLPYNFYGLFCTTRKKVWVQNNLLSLSLYLNGIKRCCWSTVLILKGNFIF